jgi:hypothetical protein
MTTDRKGLNALGQQLEGQIQELHTGMVVDVNRVALESELLDKQHDIELLLKMADMDKIDG